MKKIAILLSFVMLLISCETKQDIEPSPIVFKRVLIFGNSITNHAPGPHVGWYGSWGMAASVQSKDFSHIIGRTLGAEISPVNIGEFESQHQTYDLKNLDINFTKMPDLIIIKIGENVLQPTGFNKSFNLFITYIKDKAPLAKIVIAGTFWQNDPVNAVLVGESTARKIPFVKLQHLDTQVNKSFIGEDMFSVDGSKYKISNQDVANHPGDVGMKNIAEAILLAVKELAKQ